MLRAKIESNRRRLLTGLPPLFITRMFLGPPVICHVLVVICSAPILGPIAGDHIMKRLLIAVALLFSIPAQAASISLISEETSDHPAVILIKGSFLKGEENKDVHWFTGLIWTLKKPAIIFLDGNGGVLLGGIEIGELIRQRGFSTVVDDHTACASTCALIWLAGKERYVGKFGHLGFHSARTSEQPPQISGPGNAMVGAYLYQMGVREYREITFLTEQPPISMKWVNLADMISHDIYAENFDPSQPRWAWAKAALDAYYRDSRNAIATSEAKAKD